MRKMLHFALCSTLVMVPAIAASPETIRYQGQLTDDAGVPISSVVDLTFGIYDAASSGTQLWTETVTGVDLSVTNGRVDLALGETVPIASSVFAQSNRWLEIVVTPMGDAATLLSPRQELSSVPFAHTSNRVSDHTLDDAYDSGGAGGGRTITADGGAMSIEGPGGLVVAGSVGIGTVAPAAKFHFEGDQMFVRGTATNGNAALDVDNTGNGAIALFRGNGNVGIGTTTPASKFHFEGGQMFIVGTASNGNAALDVDNMGNGPIALFRGNGSVGIGTISPTETLTINGTVSAADLSAAGGLNHLCSTEQESGRIGWCSSALRFKDDLRDLDLPGLGTVHALRPRRFSWRNDGTQDLGFVAEEVAAVDPLLATYGADGEIVGVKYEQLTAILVKALQEQEQELSRKDLELEALKTSIENLDTRLSKFEALLHQND